MKNGFTMRKKYEKMDMKRENEPSEPLLKWISDS